MLLGQAESGKSTLQKQFQLYYASQTLDQERPSWRPMVYSNVVKALRMILDELSHQYAANDSHLSPTESVASSSSTPVDTARSSSWPPDLKHLQTKLAPLVANEEALASELSGGITVSGGRTGVYVRAGWQALITPNRAWPVTDIRQAAARPTVITTLVGNTLLATQNEIAELWQHSAVRKLISSNRVRLEESAALYVTSAPGDRSLRTLISVISFLNHIRRIADSEYLPSTGAISL